MISDYYDRWLELNCLKLWSLVIVILRLWCERLQEKPCCRKRKCATVLHVWKSSKKSLKSVARGRHTTNS